MSLQRQHFLLRYLNTVSVGPAGVWTHDLPHGSPMLNQLSQPWNWNSRNVDAHHQTAQQPIGAKADRWGTASTLNNAWNPPNPSEDQNMPIGSLQGVTYNDTQQVKRSKRNHYHNDKNEHYTFPSMS